MAVPLTRVTQKQFGSTGPAGDFGVFGSKAANAPVFSQDPATIQSLAAFLKGWGSSIIGNYDPPMEDMNSLFLLAFRQLAYIFEKGVPEYDPLINYFTGSLVQEAGVIYNSQIDSNIGNDPASDNGTNWKAGVGGQNGGVPTGTILPWGGPVNAIPAGYLLGIGQTVSRVTYAQLFAIFGTLYGAGDGATTFNLPNGRTRVLVGSSAGDTNFGTVGQVGGTTTNNLSHTHAMQGDGGANGPVDTANFFNRVKFANGSLWGITGGQQAPGVSTTVTSGLVNPVNNLQPYLTIGGIIIKT